MSKQTADTPVSNVAGYNPFERIIITSPNNFCLKLDRFAQAGPQCLQLVTDFDYTLSKTVNHDVKVPASYALLASLLDDACKKKAQDLTDYYLPIERDASLPADVRAKSMSDWSRQGNQLFIESNITKTQIQETVRNSPLILRFATDSVFQICETNNIPVTVVSGGVGNIITAALEPFGQAADVRANFLQWNASGVPTSFSQPSISSVAKATALAQEELRPNVIVLGDILEDVQVVEQARYSEALTIGFLKESQKHLLEDFQKYYDVVIEHDGNLTLVEYIINRIVGNNFSPENWPSLSSLTQYFP